MLHKLLSGIAGMILTVILAIFGAYFATLLGMAISSNIVEHKEMPDNALPFFAGGVVSFYLGILWQKVRPKNATDQ